VGLFVVHYFAFFFQLWCFMVHSSLLHGRDMVESGKKHPALNHPINNFKRKKQKKKKASASAAVVTSQKETE
jgi:hypothetical protein